MLERSHQHSVFTRKEKTEILNQPDCDQMYINKKLLKIGKVIDISQFQQPRPNTSMQLGRP